MVKPNLTLGQDEPTDPGFILIFENLGNNVMSLLGLKKGQQVKSDMDHFDSLSKEKQEIYQQ